MELNRKQLAFAHEMVNLEPDGTRKMAVLRAGYSNKGADQTACRLLKNPHIVAFIEKRKQKIMDIADVNQERVVRELANIAFSNVKDFVNVGTNKDGEANVTLTDWALLSKEQTACIESVCQTKEGYRLKLYSKPTALEQLGKYLNMYNQEPKGYEEPDPFKDLTKEQLDRACDGELAVLGVPNSHVS